MSGRILENGNINDEVESQKLIKIGHHKVDFTNWDNEKKPEILVSSSLELGGEIYTFDKQEEIESDGLEGLLYIRTKIEEDKLSFIYTPTCSYAWDQKKRGLYDADGNRVIGSLVYSSLDESYKNKKNFLDKPKVIKGEIFDIIIDDNTCKIYEFVFFKGFFYGLAIHAGGSEMSYAYIVKTFDGESLTVVHASSSIDGYYAGKCGIVNDKIYFTQREDNTTEYIYYSEDGSNFVSPTWDSWNVSSHRLVNFIYKNGRYFRYHYQSGYYSDDFVNWYEIDDGVIYLRDVKLYNGVFVLSGTGGTTTDLIRFSADGINFSDSMSFTFEEYRNRTATFTILDGVLLLQRGRNIWTSTNGANYTAKEDYPEDMADSSVVDFVILNDKIFARNNEAYVSEDFGFSWTRVLESIEIDWSKFSTVLNGYLFTPVKSPMNNDRWFLKTKDLKNWSRVVNSDHLYASTGETGLDKIFYTDQNPTTFLVLGGIS